MPQLVELGNQAGEAAPGEYGPSALLTTPGLVIMRDPTTGFPAQKTPPGYPIVDLGRAYTPSSTNEGSLLAAGAATAGLFAAGVAVGDLWDVELKGTLFNNSGTSTFTSRLRAYFGAYPFFDITSPALTSVANPRIWIARLRVIVETIGTAGTGTLRVSGDRIGLDTIIGSAASGWHALPSAGAYGFQDAESTGASASPALITNAASDFNVTATHSNATALMTTTLNECVVRYYPKNR